MPISLHVDTPAVRIGTIGSLIVTCYRTTPTVETLDEVDRVESELVTRFPRVATLAIAGPESSFLRIDEKVRGAAIVIASRGLSAVMARSFMTAFLLMSRQSWPIQTFPSVETAARWLEGLAGNDVTVSVAELEAFDRGE